MATIMRANDIATVDERPGAGPRRCGGIGLGHGPPPPATCTEKEWVARPAPPFQTSNPASTSIRYHERLR
jgi:hypothetical protein